MREENPRVTSGGRIAPAAQLGACADPPSPPGELCSSSQCCRNQHTELAPSLVQEPPRPCSAAPSLPPLGLQGGRVPDPEPAGSLLPSAAPCLPPLRSLQGKLCPRLGPRVSRAAPLLCQAPPSCCPSVVLTVLIYSTSPHLRRSPNAFAATPPGFIPPRGPEGRRWRCASGGGGGHGARGAPGSSTPESRAGEAGGGVEALGGTAWARRAAWRARLEWEKYQHASICSSTPTDHCILIRALLPFHLRAPAGDNCHSLVRAVP